MSETCDNEISHGQETQPLNSSVQLNKQRKKCEDFDQILTLIGAEGRYQKLLVYGFVVPLIIVAPLMELSLVFLMDVPDHWCHVPGMNNTDLNITEWKRQTLPMEVGPDGEERSSQCTMFDPDYPETGVTIPCQYGWEYDKTYYESTIPSAYDWVCDKMEYATGALSAGTAGSAVGTFVYGILADKIGRKPIFFLCVTIYLIFRVASLFVAKYTVLFRFLWFLSCTATPTIYLNPALAIAEVSGVVYRSWIYAVIWFIWVFGNALLPFIVWFSREYLFYGLMTSLPGLIILLYYPFLLESPRWLITVGEEKQAEKILQKIAKINGVSIEETEIKYMVKDLMAKQKMDAQKNKNIGAWTLFQWPRIAKHTMLLCIASSFNSLLYNGITLNTTSIKGNKFLNYFYLALIELPSGYLAGLLVEKTGRRWTQAGFFFMSVVCCGWSALFAHSHDLGSLVLLGALGIKFAVSVSSLVVALQGTEVFPTQLRSTGSGMVTTVSCIVGITGPIIVFTGKWNASLPYVILSILAGVGMITAAFLPETLHQSLPSTLEEANNFGKGEKFWSYLPEDVSRKRAEKRASKRSQRNPSLVP